MKNRMSHSSHGPTRHILQLATRLTRLLEKEKYAEATDLAKELWSLYGNSALSSSDRSSLLLPLTKVADLFRYKLHDTPLAIRVLKAITAIPEAASPNEPSGASSREWAAYQLGHIYHAAGCLQSSVLWFERALQNIRDSTADNAPDTARLLLSLVPLAVSYTYLDRIPDALRCYREIISLIPGDSRSSFNLRALTQPGIS